VERSFAITDIHGCAATFKMLVEDIICLTASDKLYLLGDYIDRGPDSKGVLDYIMYLRNNGFQTFALRGNHEEMLLRAYESEQYLELWMKNGGMSTLKSFNAFSIHEIPDNYIRFLKDLPFYCITDSFVMVHAGLNFSCEDPMQDEESMLWLRNFEVDTTRTGGRGIIHGHTPISLVKIHDSIHQYSSKHKINLDNGCVFGKHDIFGHLCALELENFRIYCQSNVEGEDKKKPPL
jgi:serine/threonine protein phosphatase 1